MPRVSNANRMAARTAAANAQTPNKGFDQSKLKDVVPVGQAGKAADAAAPAKKPAGSRSMYNADRDEKVIATVEKNGPYPFLKSLELDDVSEIISRYRKTGNKWLRSALYCLATGGWGIFPSKLHSEQVVAILYNPFKKEMLDSYRMTYNFSKKAFDVVLSDVVLACKKLEMTDEQIQEYLKNGYLIRPISKDAPSKQGQMLFELGEALRLGDTAKAQTIIKENKLPADAKGITKEELDNYPEYRVGRIVSSIPNGMPIIDYISNVKRTLVRFLSVKDAEGNNMGYVFKDHYTKKTYTLTEMDLNNMAYGMNVSATSDKGDTLVLRYNPFENKVTPASWLGNSLKAAQGLEAAADKSEAMDYSNEQNIVDDLPEETAEAPGMEM